MSASKRDLVRWVRRYEAAERRIRAERRARPPTPDESLRRALALDALARDARPAERPAEPSAEDVAAWSTWARLRLALRG